jgi:hypothetical protein
MSEFPGPTSDRSKAAAHRFQRPFRVDPDVGDPRRPLRNSSVRGCFPELETLTSSGATARTRTRRRAKSTDLHSGARKPEVDGRSVRKSAPGSRPVEQVTESAEDRDAGVRKPKVDIRSVGKSAPGSRPVERATEPSESARDRDARVERDESCEIATLDGLALSLKLAMDRITPCLARAASRFVTLRGWVPFGYSCLENYAQERLGRSGRWVRNLAKLDEGFSKLPGLWSALEGGRGRRSIGQVAASEIARVATPKTVGAWISLARRIPVRQLKQRVREARAANSEWPLITKSPNRTVRSTASSDSDCGRRDGSNAPVDKLSSEESPSPSKLSTRDAQSSSGEPGSRRTDRRQEHPQFNDDNVEPDPDERFLVSLSLPAPIRAAFDETRRLFTAVCGRDGSVADFVEALVAEALAGPVSFDDDRAPLHSTGYQAKYEALLAEGTDNFSHLPDASNSGERAVVDLLKRFEWVMRQVGKGGPAELSGQMGELIALEDELHRELGRLLMTLSTDGGWKELGFAGLEHYAEQRLGISRTTARDRVRVTRELLDFPRIREAYESGRIGFEITLILLRTLGHGPVDERSERAWVERAERSSLKRMRDEQRVNRLRSLFEPGSGPRAPLDDRSWFDSLRLGPGDVRGCVQKWGLESAQERMPSVRFSLRLRRDLAAGFEGAIEGWRQWLESRLKGESNRVFDLPGLGEIELRDPRAFSQAAQVDADQADPWDGFDTIAPDDLRFKRLRTLRRLFAEEETKGLDVNLGDGSAVEVEESIALQVARVCSLRIGRVPPWVGLLAMLEDFVDTWDNPEGVTKRRADLIYIRDGWRCAAPGCTKRVGLESHHLQYLSRGGPVKALVNQLTLCAFHHRKGEHGSFASCRGKAPLDIVWRLGQPGMSRWYRNELRT